MRNRWVYGFLVLAFAVCVGHVAWHSCLGPPLAPTYPIGGPVVAFRAPDGAARHLYLRRQLYLPRRPRQAWIQVLGRDVIELFVNGEHVAMTESDRFNVGLVADLTPRLKAGVNTIGIAAHQASLGGAPVVAVEGACVLDDGVHWLRADDSWRCSTVFERGAGGWWFSNEFHDGHWPSAKATAADLRCSVDFPPRTRTDPPGGRWVAPAALPARCGVFRREFAVSGRPRQAWLRVTTRSPYRMAVNGILLDEQEDRLATFQPGEAVQRNYDLTPVVHSGGNTVSLLVQSIAGPAEIMADLEVEDGSGTFHRFDTDGRWQAFAGAPKGWFDADPAGRIDWSPCRVEAGDLDMLPWRVRRADVGLVLPLGTVVRRAAGEAAVMILVGLLTALACRFVAPRFALPGAALAYLPLVLPTVALAGGLLVQYDPRILRQDVYAPCWVWLALASVPAQWIALMCLCGGLGRRWRRPPAGEQARRRPAYAWAIILSLACLVAIGFWLRFRLITSETLHPDEVTLYHYAQGWLERGFPSMQISKDLPICYISGCELESLGTALASLVFTRDDYIVRFPTVCYGTLTILLVFFVGRRLFNSATGLAAAALYTFSPYCCEVASFGRYESQAQLLILATVYFFYRTVAGKGPISRRYLGLTALSFAGVFLSWEGSAFLAAPLVLFALIYRRRRLRSIIGEPAVWAALAAVLAVVLLQQANQYFQMRKFLIVGTGWGDLKLKPMWTFPFFMPWRYTWEASWNRDALLPCLGVIGAALLAVRHRWRHPLRLLLLSLLVPTFLLSLLFPMIASRYSYPFVPFGILLSSAALAAGLGSLAPRRSLADAPPGIRSYARGVCLLAALVLVGLGSGMPFELEKMGFQLVLPAKLGRYGQLKYPAMKEAVAYVAQHLQPGDVVIALQPEVFNHYAAVHSAQAPAPLAECDYGLQTLLELYTLLPDSTTVPIFRFCSTPMIADIEGLESVLASHRRVWYVTTPNVDEINKNRPSTLVYLEENMDVVYQDYLTAVMLRDLSRPASRRLAQQQDLRQAPFDIFGSQRPE